MILSNDMNSFPDGFFVCPTWILTSTLRLWIQLRNASMSSRHENCDPIDLWRSPMSCSSLVARPLPLRLLQRASLSPLSAHSLSSRIAHLEKPSEFFLSLLHLLAVPDCPFSKQSLRIKTHSLSFGDSLLYS